MYYIDWSRIFASMAENLPIMAENPQGYSLMLYSFPRKDLISSVIIFYFIYLFFNFARLIIGYSLFTLLPFFFVSFCQSKFFELAPLLPIVTLCMEIGFLISDHELNQIGRVWPWGWGAGPLHPYWWGVVFAWPGGQHHCWLGAWPGYSKFLLFIAQLPFVALLFLNWLLDCSCINLYSVATVFF